jgi:hypothetical protein
MMAGVAALALGWIGAASAETALERGNIWSRRTRNIGH